MTFTVSATLKRNQKLQLLGERLQKYPNWQKWFKSHYCPLTVKEIIVIEQYYTHQNHHVTADLLNLSVGRVRQILNKGYRKLKWCEGYYNQWEKYQKLNTVQTQDYNLKNINFLNSHLSSHNISDRLIKDLAVLGCNSMADVLKYNKTMLLHIKGIKKKDLYELEDYLKENNITFS